MKNDPWQDLQRWITFMFGLTPSVESLDDDGESERLSIESQPFIES